jgi:hypothetical protein
MFLPRAKTEKQWGHGDKWKKPNVSNGFREKGCGDKVGTEWGQSGDIKRMKKRIHSFIHKKPSVFPLFALAAPFMARLSWLE